MIVAIIVISVLPGVVEFVREWRRRKGLAMPDSALEPSGAGLT